MSETENNAQGQKPKTSKLAIASMYSAFIGLASILVMLAFFLFEPIISDALLAVGIFCIIFGFIAGIIGLICIKNSKGALKGAGRTVIGLLPGLLLIALYFLVVGRGRIICMWDIDEAKLSALTVAIDMYTIEYGELPPEENFKQILLERNIIEKEDTFYSGHGKNILLRYYQHGDNYILVSPGKNKKYDTPEGYENIKEFREKTDDIIRTHERIGMFKR